MAYVRGSRVMIRDSKRNRYRMAYGPDCLEARTVTGIDSVQGRIRLYLDGPPLMAWAGDVKLATDKKGL